MTSKRKSLLIGINYTGSQNELHGCQSDVRNVQEFISYRGYTSDPRSQVIMTDAHDPRGPYFPSGHNILAAMDWLVSEPNTINFLHYSGHGGQVEDESGQSTTGLADTIVPVDFERNGQIPSSLLHRHLVSNLAPGSSLFVILDCCHSGSCLELPFAYRSDEDGNVGMIDNLKKGMQMLGAADHLIQGGFSFQKLGEAEDLYAGATDFFRGFTHRGEHHEAGLGTDDYTNEWGGERKMVTMFSGCRDDQTSADASISGASVGAMSWAFLQTMKHTEYPTYLGTLQMTRQFLDQSHYVQIPQLSIGVEMDLNQPLML